jgi:hypothetical protein
MIWERNPVWSHLLYEKNNKYQIARYFIYIEKVTMSRIVGFFPYQGLKSIGKTAAVRVRKPDPDPGNGSDVMAMSDDSPASGSQADTLGQRAASGGCRVESSGARLDIRR